MLSVKIEKEIRQENKIVFGLNLRQLLCSLAALVVCIAILLTSKMEFTDLLVPFLIIATIFGAFGWVKKDGMHLEHLLVRKIKEFIYQNQKLGYRTQNRFVKLMNRGYLARQIEESKTKKPKDKKKVKKAKSTMPYYY